MKINETKELSSGRKYMLDAFYDDRQFYVIEVDGALYLGLEDDGTLRHICSSSNIFSFGRTWTVEEYIMEDPNRGIAAHINETTKLWNRHYKAEMKRYEKEHNNA